MVRKIFVILAVIALTSTVVLAKEGKKDVKQPATASAQAQVPLTITTPQEKEALMTNINNMRNQELRAAVLGQLLNEEIAKLRDVQTAFCSKYKLDMEKFRQGLYRYDEQQGRFIETLPASATSPAPATSLAPATSPAPAKPQK